MILQTNTSKVTSVRLGDVCSFKSGNSLTSGQEFLGQENGFLLLKVSDLNRTENTPVIKTANSWVEAGVMESASCKSGSIIIPKRGGAIATNKKRLLGRPAALDPNLMGIEPNPEKVDSLYLYFWFQQFDLTQITSGSAVPQLNKQDLAPLKFPLLPIAEQRRIAAILDRADAVRRKRQEAIALTEELLRSAFLEMFGDLFAFLNGHRNSHPKGWIKCQLGDQLTLQRGFDITQKQCQKGHYPVISSGGVSAHHSEYKALGPGVLLGRKGSVGRVHYVEENYWPHDTTLWVRDFKGNHPTFVYYFFKLFPISNFEESTANPTLNRNRLHPVDIFWPSYNYQALFANVSDSIAECRKMKDCAVSESANLFNSLLQRAFRGEL